jgi:hypothetical protein
VALLAMACGRLGYEAHRADAGREGGADGAASDASIRDAAPDSAAPDGSCKGAWGAPSLIVPLDAAGGDDDPSFTADLLELYFASHRPGGPLATNLWRSTRASTDDPWGAPVLVEEIGGVNTPHVSGDGLTLWYSRGNGMGDEDLWNSTRASRSDPWGAPSVVSEISRVGYDDKAPAPYAGGLRLIFASDRPDTEGSLDFYLARRATTSDPWDTVVQHLTDVSTSGFESRPWLIESGKYFYFHALRNGDTTSDIYVAEYSDVTRDYGNVRAVAELNTEFFDEDIAVSNDECYAVFSSTRINNDGALFETYRAR